MDLSVAFATSSHTPAHIEQAEDLGFRRAWCYDSPGLYPDVWMVLALAAKRTSRIGLGPGVLVPSLRHPMTNAAAIATLEHLAPGRVAVAIGSGFTGRHVLGQRPLRWADVAAYVRCLRSLLRGDDAEWEGAIIRMIHPPGFVAERPVDVPILIGADGPKGLAVANEVGDGMFSAANPAAGPGDEAPGWRALLAFGTVLDDGEDVRSERVQRAAGHAVAVAFHAVYERGGEAVDGLPGGQAWRERIEAIPADRRHLAVHEGHLVEVADHDADAVREAADLLPALSFTGSAAQLQEKLAGYEAAGITELAWQPAGDIPSELDRMAAALGLDVPA